MPGSHTPSSSSSPRPRKRAKGTRNATRPRPLPPDVTARNLAVEKERRQALNQDFLSLARLVPSLSSTRRLSKALIVNEAKAHLSQRRSMCINAANDVRRLLAENARLAAELNSARSQLLLCPGEVPFLETATPATDAVNELMGVENEPSGEFPADSWDTWSGRPRKASNTKPTGETGDAPAQAASQQGTVQGAGDSVDIFQDSNFVPIGATPTPIYYPDPFSSGSAPPVADYPSLDLSEYSSQWPGEPWQQFLQTI